MYLQAAMRKSMAGKLHFSLKQESSEQLMNIDSRDLSSPARANTRFSFLHELGMNTL